MYFQRGNEHQYVKNFYNDYVSSLEEGYENQRWYSNKVSENHDSVNDTIKAFKVEVDEDYEHIAFNVERNIQHQRWIDSKVSEGWRYGMKHSEEDKVSPLLRPWEQLSETSQNVCIEKYFDR